MNGDQLHLIESLEDNNRMFKIAIEIKMKRLLKFCKILITAFSVMCIVLFALRPRLQSFTSY